jgi:thiol-disulfide isomerase/thioredoxin
MIEITNDMEKVVATKNAVTYFTASWCSPCKKLKPIFGKAGMQDNNYTYFVVDVDEIDSSYITKYNIQSVPSVFQMENGEVVRRISSRTAEEIIEEVNLPF